MTSTTDSLLMLSRRLKVFSSVLPSIPVTWILPVLSFRIRNRTFFRSRVSWTQPFRRTLSWVLNASLIRVLSMRGLVYWGF